jgi:hypothetical protein
MDYILKMTWMNVVHLTIRRSHIGYIRNDEMAQYADALIAFWDGFSNC